MLIFVDWFSPKIPDAKVPHNDPNLSFWAKKNKTPKNTAKSTTLRVS